MRLRPPDWRPRIGRSARGNTLIEFALVLPLFMLFVLGTFEFAHLFYVQLTLQSAVREATRVATVGGTLPDPANPGQQLSRAQSIVARVQAAAPGLDVVPGDVTILGPGGAGDPGGPGDLVTIRVEYDIPILTPIVGAMFPGGSHRVSMSMITKNEPWPEN